jgi:hypothetical protein
MLSLPLPETSTWSTRPRSAPAFDATPTSQIANVAVAINVGAARVLVLGHSILVTPLGEQGDYKDCPSFSRFAAAASSMTCS